MDERLMPGRKKDKKKELKNEATWCTPSKLLSQEIGLLLTADAGVLPGRFYELLSPVLLLLSLTVLQLVED
ncbi:hypothetical protein LAZ67_3002193 [Cordylochernes scorpioides]|uniref:Uncharacterized protein n=1 Tax=Cordylochernes scorpioides TaxID=51811 RepID=A0ABY6K9D4_9ARAC|nr:hypothetical protein LAZ67_3002193 [Cordylochernes scorpioides]